MILLDDSQSSSSKPSSRLYESASHSWCIYPSNTDEQSWQNINHCLTEISSALSRGEFVVAVFAYELGNLIPTYHREVQNTLSWRHGLLALIKRFQKSKWMI